MRPCTLMLGSGVVLGLALRACLAAVPDGGSGSAGAAGPAPGTAAGLSLDDLWEDTPATRDLSYAFRIYKRKRLANRLHRQLRLYLVYPPDARPAEPRPAVVFIHGGGWGAGDADQWFPPCRYFALRGVVGVSVDYRLKDGTTSIADCLTDCKSAVRYLRAHAAELGIRPDRIVVVGESAGGHLAAALGTVEGFDEPGEDLSVSTVPDAMILLNPITDLSTRWGKSLGDRALSLSPLHRVGKRTPPALLVHGDADPVVDVAQTLAFHEKMRALGIRSDLVVLPGVRHAFAVFRYGPDHLNARAILDMDRWLASMGYVHGEPLLRPVPEP